MMVMDPGQESPSHATGMDYIRHSLRGVQLTAAEQCGFSANLACRVSARILAVYFGDKPALQCMEQELYFCKFST